MTAKNIAIFVDVENLTNWVKHCGPEYLMETLHDQGSVTVRKAYGNWSNSAISSLQVSLDRLGFDLSHNFHPVSGKNSADIQLTIDVMDHVWRMPELTCFVLATGDSDFSPLFRALRAMGKEVIGVGPKSPLSKSVESSCSRYVYTDIVREKPQRLTSSGFNKAMALARNTLRNLNGYAHCSELKKRMLLIDPEFDEKKHGFPTFKAFLERVNAIRLTPITGSHEMVAYIDMKQETPKPVTPEASSESTEKKETTLEQYQRYLRNERWHPVSKSVLVRIYHATAALEAMSMVDLENRLAANLNRHVSRDLIHHSLTVFMKSGLFNLSLKSDGAARDTKLWKLEKKPDYIRDIDFSLLTRLLTAIDEHKQVIDLTVIEALLYGRYSLQEQHQLVSDASTKLINLNY
jgi:hypothetical protein